MKVVISIPSQNKISNLQIPEVINQNVKKIYQHGIDGDTLCYIIDISKEILSVAANISAIAGFIYMIVHDHKGGRVSINGKTVEQTNKKDEIEDALAINEEYNDD